ncbi:MAG: hypothetical protein CSA66_05880 [Proteobacteria bacterium]|nr:MAG: hypothetical protein CSA66_05880 [Pseudomonadota bacterium]
MKLHPFRALRPAPEHAQAVMSPPYDVVSAAEARAFAEGNPRSFFHVTRPEIDLPDGVDPYGAGVYEAGAAALRRLRDDGTMIVDEAPAVWLYRLTRGDHVQVGFVGCADVDDYAAGRVKKHELTRKKKEDDRTQHILTLGAQAGPVLLACRVSDAIAAARESLTSRPAELRLEAADGVLHELWAVREASALSQLAEAFAPLDAFYIADGHHRAASAERVRDAMVAEGKVDGPWQRFLVVVFPDDQLEIMDYNRVVADLNGLEPDDFLARVFEKFHIGDQGAKAAPSGHHRFGMYLDGAWRQLTARTEIVDDADPIRSLDVAILQDHLLGPILGIGDPRTDPRIDFVGGIRGTDALSARVDAAGQGVAFAMYPTSLAELFAVADAGLIMPPKSTWFEPKLASGLFLNLFE